jgi:hypothetical protein
MRPILAFPLALALVAAALAPAEVLDPSSDPVELLQELAEPLGAAEIDVLHRHDSPTGRSGPSFGDAPRLAPLLGFRAWPGIGVDLDRHGQWLDAFASGARGALAAAPTDGGETRPDRDEFREIWGDAEDGTRVLVTFDASDREVAERVAGVLEERGYAVYLAVADPDREPLDPEIFGALFVSADVHLTIDTASARLNAVIQFEAELLAELRKQDAWVAAGGHGLPPVTRGPMDVIETLGVLPMQVLPGGIVLGVRPKIDKGLDDVRLAVNGSDFGLAMNGHRYTIEQVSKETREAIRAFVGLTDSHSVVDIAGSDVTLAEPFRDTRIGERMIKADKQPFDHLSVSGAQKSLIVDQAIRIRRDGDDDVAIDVTLEVRFYRRDREGHADRLATLRFTVEDATGSARLLDLAWSRRPGRSIGFDGSGVDGLTDALEPLALDAALIGLTRLDAAEVAATDGP